MKTYLLSCFLPLVLIVSQANATLVLYPVADIKTIERTTSAGFYTYDGPTTNTVNFAWHEMTYLKFDLSQLSNLSDVTGMSLRLYETTNSWNYSPDKIDLYFTNDHSWDESSDFADMPTHSGQLIYQVNHTAGWNNWVTWDMSSYDLVNNSVDDTLTLVLENNQGGAWNMTSFFTSDYSDSNYWPQLVLEGNAFLVPEPSTLVFILLSMIPIHRLRVAR